MERKVEGEVSVTTPDKGPVKVQYAAIHLMEKQDLAHKVLDDVTQYEMDRATEASRHRVGRESVEPLKTFVKKLAAERPDVEVDNSFGKWKSAALEAVDKVQKEAADRLESTTATYAQHPVATLWSRVYEKLGSPVAKTDADGRFQVRVPRQGEWYILATTPKIDRHAEEHDWCLPIKGLPSGRLVELSDNDQIDDPGLLELLKKVTNAEGVPLPEPAEIPSQAKANASWVAQQQAELETALVTLRDRSKNEEIALTKAAADAQRKLQEDKDRKEKAAKAIEQARLQAAMEETIRINSVGENRQKGVDQKVSRLVLNTGQVLENLTVRGFNDDGITFSTESGALRVKWPDLPVEWVNKYCDPAAAKAAEHRAAEEAAIMTEVEQSGQSVDVEFVRETTSSNESTGFRGAVVKVIHVERGPTSKNPNEAPKKQEIFILNMGKLAFDSSKRITVRIFATGRSFTSKDKKSWPMYVGTAGLALQLARDAKIGLSTMKDNRL